MPGITAWFPARADPRDGERFERAQRRMVHGSEAKRVDASAPGLWLGHVAGEHYPVAVWREPEFTLVLEGRIHGTAEPRRALALLFRRAFAAADPLVVVSEFVRASDGEYLAAAATRDRCLAFGDALGRLPVYVQRDGDAIAFARECKFLASIRGAWSFDRLGLGEHLWFGYPLGERTLFEGIERAPEGFFLDVRTGWPAVAPRSTWMLRCDAGVDGAPAAEAAGLLAQKLLDAARACAGEADSSTPIVSLSGGNDSRAVLAALARVRPDCVAATFRRPGGRQADDVEIARALARSLGVRWECIDLPEIDLAAEERLVWWKDGLNPAAMAFIVPFLEALAERFGARATLHTGDGGDKLFPDLRPARLSADLPALVETLAAEAALAPASDIERALGLEAGELSAAFRRRLESYPEASPEHRAVHWKLAERSRKWLFEGEDRNRFVLWQTSPFLARSVFEAALRVPQREKADLRFYAEVQRHLDPRLLGIPHADAGLSIDSVQFRTRSLARRWALRVAGPLRAHVRRRIRASEPVNPALRAHTLLELESALARSPQLAAVASPEHCRQMIARSSAPVLQNWRTVLLLDRLWRERIPGPR